MRWLAACSDVAEATFDTGKTGMRRKKELARKTAERGFSSKEIRRALRGLDVAESWDDTDDDRRSARRRGRNFSGRN
jgi:hypothetical protein